MLRFYLIAALAMFGQSPAAHPAFDAFEVATIKPSKLDWPSEGRFMRMQSVHQFVARNYTLKVMLAAAYYLTPRAVSGGPAWVDSERFDILAEAPNQYGRRRMSTWRCFENCSVRGSA